MARAPSRPAPRTQAKTRARSPQAGTAATFNALDAYQAGGYTLAALDTALEALQTAPLKEAERTEQFEQLLKRICLSANGAGFALRVTAAQLHQALQFLVAVCDKSRSVESALMALRATEARFHADCAALLTAFAASSPRVVKKLVTHLGKVRNPDSEPGYFVRVAKAPTPFVIGSSVSSRCVTIVDAGLVGWRWLWEATLHVDGVHRTAIDVLADEPAMRRHLRIPELALPAIRLPDVVGGLSPQLLFKSGDAYVAITPVTSVGAFATISAPQADHLRRLRKSEREYGGANARNIAALLMDRSGRVRHPVCIPVFARETNAAVLLRRLFHPASLIGRAALTQRTVDALFAERLPAHTNADHDRRIANLVIPLLEERCGDLLAVRAVLLESPSSLTDAQRSALLRAGPINKFLRGAGDADSNRELASLICYRLLSQERKRDHGRWREIHQHTCLWLEAQTA